jgi:adsorption protein B
MSQYDWLLLLRDVFAGATWFVALIYFFSGLQDLFYDVGAWWLRTWRRLTYRKNPRLSLERLRAREQQRIAVMVPAWNEGEVVASMVDNIIKRVEYENYNIFVGTYPNDAATQACVDRLAKEYPQIIKVVTARPGPTTKADCLHNVLRTIRNYEETHAINFDIIVMHDAEDWVHPQSFLLHNYLIPQVDVIQLPILPLPTKWNQWVHWIYADEFCENHMKDVPVREKISGFVPYAGTGTGFSRKVIDFLSDEHEGHVFNESSMTEDYSMSKKIREAGLRSVFVNVVLADDRSPFWVPLSKRPYFISNWSYFPMDWTRSVRQKARWIIGISLQEWEQSGWEGSWLIKENLIKDRKSFVAATASFVGYFILLYFIVYGMGQAGWIPFKLLNILRPGEPLTHLVQFCTLFMVVRISQRIWWVTLTYGIVPGLLSVPRLMVGNILNGLATFRALKVFADSRQGKAAVRWDNTLHLEGVGDMGGEEVRRGEDVIEWPLEQVLADLSGGVEEEIVRAVPHIPQHAAELDRAEAIAYLRALLSSPSLRVRASIAQAVGRLNWPELVPTLFRILGDPDWVVRSNAAKSLLNRPKFALLVEQAFTTGSPVMVETLVRVIEQDKRRQQTLFNQLESPELTVTKATLFVESPILRKRYLAWKSSASEN